MTLELKSSEVTTKPTRYLERTQVRTKEGYNFGSDASCVQDMLKEFNMSALESTPALSWNRREADEKDLPASAENCCGLTERTYVAMGKASWSIGRESDTDMRNIK